VKYFYIFLLAQHLVLVGSVIGNLNSSLRFHFVQSFSISSLAPIFPYGPINASEITNIISNKNPLFQITFIILNFAALNFNLIFITVILSFPDTSNSLNHPFLSLKFQFQYRFVNYCLFCPI